MTTATELKTETQTEMGDEYAKEYGFLVGNYYESRSNGFIQYCGLNEDGEPFFRDESGMEVFTCDLEWHSK